MMNASGRTRQGMAITSLVLGILGLPTAGCLGLGAIIAVILGIVALVKANKNPDEYGGKGMAIGGIVTGSMSLLMAPVVGGIIAAIAIPSLLRARVSANEAGAIGDTRAVISSEVTYAGANNGYYDSLECLANPGGCIPGYQGPSMLGPELVATEKMGYRRTLHLGVPPVGQDPSARISPTSVVSFAYVSVPIQQNRTGMRGFCGDDSGRICVTTNGIEPRVEDGRCADPCNVLP